MSGGVKSQMLIYSLPLLPISLDYLLQWDWKVKEYLIFIITSY